MEILLFSHDQPYSAAAIAAGMGAVIVDWEWSGKPERQIGNDTQINRGTLHDLVTVGEVAAGRLICRINNTDEGRRNECRLAIEHGASEIWLPMVRDVVEIEECLRSIDGDARLGVLVETREAMFLGRQLQQLPLSRVYIGLHDYRIDCGNRGIFDPIVDGSVDRFRETYSGPLGFAGVTLPDAGRPVPQHLLLAAMVRLRCSFGVARRSFRADVAATDIGSALAMISDRIAELEARSMSQQHEDQLALTHCASSLRNDLRMRHPEPACAP